MIWQNQLDHFMISHVQEINLYQSEYYSDSITQFCRSASINNIYTTQNK